MSRQTNLALALVLVALGIGSASAATITYNDATTPAVVGISLRPTELNGTIEFPQWDPSAFPGYSLDSVTFTLTAHIEGDINLNNKGDGPAEISGTTTSTFRMKDLNDNFIVVVIPAYTTGFQTIPGGGVPQVFSGLNDTQTNSSEVFTTGLGGYTGSGSFLLPVSSITGLSCVGGGGNAECGQTTFASATGTVTYAYSLSDIPSEVPEPGTFGLMGSAMAMAGFYLRRRRQA